MGESGDCLASCMQMTWFYVVGGGGGGEAERDGIPFLVKRLRGARSEPVTCRRFPPNRRNEFKEKT